MGYHDNEATTKKAVADAQRFINDRERYRHALSILGVSDEIIEQVRRADFTGVAAHARYAGSGEVVAEVVSKYGDPEAFGEREVKLLADIQKLPYGTELYTRPPAQPKVPDEQRKSPSEKGQIWADGWNACRRAMLSAQENNK